MMSPKEKPSPPDVAPTPPPEEPPEPVPYATVPEPAKPVEREYEVVGPHTVLDNKPGSSFKVTLPFEQEKFLIESGHIIRKEN